MARTFARQLPRALTFASTMKREGSPGAETACSAQVDAAAGMPASSHKSSAVDR